MSVQHMALVFAADGIKYHEKMVLLVLCNYTDAHGFCYPSERRIADDAGMPLRTVQRAKAALTNMKLVKSVRRKSRRTGEPISNLTQVNLPLLERMRRVRAAYDDNVILDSLFDPDDGSDLLTRQVGGYQTEIEAADTDTPDNRCRHTGGSVPPHRREGAATQADNPPGIPKGSLVLPPPPPPSQGELAAPEDEEEFEGPCGADSTDTDSGDDEFTVSDADRRKASSLLGAIPWPTAKKTGLGSKARTLLLERLSVLAAGGWEESDIREFVSSRIPDWSKVRRPSELVLHVLSDAPEGINRAFVEVEEDVDPKLAEARALHARLDAEYVQQRLDIAQCDDCDSGGYLWPSGQVDVGNPIWHDHNVMSLRIQLNRAGFAMAKLEEALAPEGDSQWELISPTPPAGS